MIGDKRLTLKGWLRLRWGTYRRLYLNIFRPGYVRASLAQRQGECLRCGTCCYLLRRCVLLKNDNGLPACNVIPCARRTAGSSRLTRAIWATATSWRPTLPAAFAGLRRKSSDYPESDGERPNP